MIDVGWGVLHNDGDDFVAIGDDGKALKWITIFYERI